MGLNANQHNQWRVYHRWLWFVIFALQAFLAIRLAYNPYVSGWVLPLGAAFSSGFLAACFGKKEQGAGGYWELPRFGMLQVAIFVTSFSIQIAIQQAIRS